MFGVVLWNQPGALCLLGKCSTNLDTTPDPNFLVLRFLSPGKWDENLNPRVSMARSPATRHFA